MNTPQNPLINRMKTDDINLILTHLHKYPTSGQYLMDSLMKVDSWLNLEYDVICHLNDVFKCGYTPTDLALLFKNK